MFPADSPFADKLHTNYVPTDSQISEIDHLLLEPTAELTRVDAQIDEQEVVITKLKAERAVLEAAIDVHRALTMPIRRIPRDIILEIFFSCLPTAHLNALIDPREAPLLLGHICRH
ncbi:hypothetical protein C8R44DRAFT_653554 [Mycena epipterygia]|nr:hypothetical protein C8R44DRAFT_653554 [Mycena epipterygia]